MALSKWQKLTTFDATRMADARVQTHYAVQWLARIARAYIAVKPDDGHTSLTWDRDLLGFVTHELQNGARFGLRLPDLSLIVVHPQTPDPSAEFPMEGRTDLDVQQWIGGQLAGMILELERAMKPLPYELPSHAISGGAKYDGVALSMEREQLTHWYANAAHLLDKVRARFADMTPPASPLRCWPHHFDLATLIALDADGSESARSIGVGLSPGDETSAKPYFYISPWPYPAAKDLPAIGPMGRWHRSGFTAAMIESDELTSSQDQESELTNSINNAIDVCFRLLSR